MAALKSFSAPIVSWVQQIGCSKGCQLFAALLPVIGIWLGLLAVGSWLFLEIIGPFIFFWFDAPKEGKPAFLISCLVTVFSIWFLVCFSANVKKRLQNERIRQSVTPMSTSQATFFKSGSAVAVSVAQRKASRGWSSSEERTRAARHEAAHAVVNHELGAEVISLHLDSESGLVTAITPAGSVMDPNNLFIRAAGQLAGHIYDLDHGWAHTGSRIDLKNLQGTMFMLRSLGVAPDQFFPKSAEQDLNEEVLMAELRAVIRRIQQKPAEKILTIGAVLEQTSYLSTAQFRRLMGAPTS